jgi:hypothetical protein
MSISVILRDVKEGDLPIFFEQQRIVKAASVLLAFGPTWHDNKGEDYRAWPNRSISVTPC